MSARRCYVVLVQELGGKLWACADAYREGEDVAAHLRRLGAVHCYYYGSATAAHYEAARLNEDYARAGISALVDGGCSA